MSETLDFRTIMLNNYLLALLPLSTKLVYDLVNFMVYMAEPIAVERERLGWWVLLFLAIFFVPVYFLNKEFWRDIK